MIDTVDAVWMLQGADPNTLRVAAFKEVFTYAWTRVFQTCDIIKDVCFTYIYPLKYLVIAGNSPPMDYLAWWIVASRNHSSEGPLPTCFTCVGKGSCTNRAAWNTAVFLSCENKIKKDHYVTFNNQILENCPSKKSKEGLDKKDAQSISKTTPGKLSISKNAQSTEPFTDSYHNKEPSTIDTSSVSSFIQVAWRWFMPT